MARSRVSPPAPDKGGFTCTSTASPREHAVRSARGSARARRASHRPAAAVGDAVPGVDAEVVVERREDVLERDRPVLDVRGLLVGRSR